MAKRLMKLEDLKSAFGKFDEMSELVEKVKVEIVEVGAKNRTAAGSDQIGKQYHEKVDEPTENLTNLVDGIRNKLLSISRHGQDTADLFDATDQHATDLVK
ncbi:hypothetical protein ACFYUY_39415 [Kitasatospora sp. NPDC004745]|uniref:hypothetical protein n=1 Tax=unclassified Kitasatospora TaxID=2633591 RepID=UPI0033F1CD22